MYSALTKSQGFSLNFAATYPWLVEGVVWVFRTNHSEVKKKMQSRFVFGSQMKINNKELKSSVAKFGITLLLSSYYKPLCLLLKRICVKSENLRQIN